MFIIRITYLTDDSVALAALRQAHYAYFAPHFESGLMILGGRLVPATGGIMIATGTDRAEVERLFAGEPYKQAGLADFEILELMPTKVGPKLDGIIAVQPF
jgi:uncharacterized protein YciI